MTKRILTIIVSAFMLTLPMEMRADDAQRATDVQRTTVEQEQKEVVITVSESNVHIKNADKAVMEVYNMAGVKVATYRVDSPEKTIELGHLPKGCYILKVGKVARKVYLH